MPVQTHEAHGNMRISNCSSVCGRGCPHLQCSSQTAQVGLCLVQTDVETSSPPAYQNAPPTPMCTTQSGFLSLLLAFKVVRCAYNFFQPFKDCLNELENGLLDVNRKTQHQNRVPALCVSPKILKRPWNKVVTSREVAIIYIVFGRLKQIILAFYPAYLCNTSLLWTLQMLTG